MFKDKNSSLKHKNKANTTKVTQAYALKTKTSALATNKELTLVKQQLKTKTSKLDKVYVKN